MPKYGIHHIVLKESVNELRASGNSTGTNAADIILAEMPSAIIGSIGPDLFFWGPDYGAVDKLHTLYKNVSAVVKLYNEVVQPIRDAMNEIGEPVEDLVETLAPQTIEMIRHLLNEIKETSRLFKAAIGTEIFAGVLEGADLLADAAGIAPLSQQFFQMFVPDLQENRDETHWYWFDMLHYRYAGKFALNLVKMARQGTDRQKAFAFGYLSHIATDVTGHPFVNQVSATTYRMNVQRHVTAENFMDTWKHHRYYGESINQTLFSRLGLPEELPSDIGDLLFDAFRETYTDVPHPTRLSGDGFYTREQINETYEVFYEVLKFMEGQTIRRPEEPFSGVADILASALDAFSSPPAPSDFAGACSAADIFGLTDRSRECYENFFKEAADWLNYLEELLKWSFATLMNLIDLLLTLFLSLPISVLLAILYGIQLMCYNIYRSARKVLSMKGFVLPEPDELDSSTARNLITPFQCPPPHGAFPSVGKPIQNNLMCPVHQFERPFTTAGFHPPTHESTPDSFIRLEPFDETALRLYAQSDSPQQTRSIGVDRRVIGNATNFTAWMIQHANDPNINEDHPIHSVLYANWNLDSDRGYGYLAWKATIPNAEPFTIEDEEYVEA